MVRHPLDFTADKPITSHLASHSRLQLVMVVDAQTQPLLMLPGQKLPPFLTNLHSLHWWGRTIIFILFWLLLVGRLLQQRTGWMNTIILTYARFLVKCGSCSVLSLRRLEVMHVHFVPDFIAKTKSPSVLDPRFGESTVSLLMDFVNRNRNEMLLCHIRAIRMYFLRPE